MERTMKTIVCVLTTRKKAVYLRTMLGKFTSSQIEGKLNLLHISRENICVCSNLPLGKFIEQF